MFSLPRNYSALLKSENMQTNEVRTSTWSDYILSYMLCRSVCACSKTVKYSLQTVCPPSEEHLIDTSATRVPTLSVEIPRVVSQIWHFLVVCDADDKHISMSACVPFWRTDVDTLQLYVLLYMWSVKTGNLSSMTTTSKIGALLAWDQLR